MLAAVSGLGLIMLSHVMSPKSLTQALRRKLFSTIITTGLMSPLCLLCVAFITAVTAATYAAWSSGQYHVRLLVIIAVLVAFVALVPVCALFVVLR